MVYSRLVVMALFGTALSLPNAANARILLEAGAGAQFHDFDEKTESGSATLESNGDGTALAYQVQLGVSGDMISLYGVYTGSGYIYDKPPGGTELVRRRFSLAGAGVHLYIAPPGESLIPYVLGGGGLLFNTEASYTGRGPGYFGGLGLKFKSPYSLEARYLGGMTEREGRSLTLNTFQIMFSLMVK